MKLVQGLEKFLLKDAPPTRLALLRILIGAFSLWYLSSRISLFASVAGTDASLYEPVGAAHLFDVPMPVEWFQLLVIALLAANVAFILGWRFRVTGPVFGLLLFFVLSYRNSWSMIFHSDNVLVFHALILGFSPAADALSLDAHKQLLACEEANSSPWWKLNSERHWRYGWAIRLLCTVTVITYFLSGVAKIFGPLGLEWMTGEALRGQVAVDGLRKELLGDGAEPLAYTLYNHLWLFTLIGVGSMVIEAGAPVALANKHVGRLWSLAAIMMHWGIFFVMGITFRYQLVGFIFLSFFPLERMLVWLDPRFISERLAARPKNARPPLKVKVAPQHNQT